MQGSHVAADWIYICT